MDLNKDHNLRQTLFQKQSGSVMVLAAILVGALFALAALGLELTYGSASLEQARHNAKLASLGALDAYMRSNGVDAKGNPIPESTRRSAALTRANEIAKLNLIVADLSQTANDLTFAGSAAQPILTPGRWFYDNNPDGSSPCSGGKKPPCFVPTDNSKRANAFRIAGPLFDPIPGIFTRVMNRKFTVQPTVNSIATSVPRQGCFIVDLSPSMASETHPLSGPNAGSFAYDLSDPDSAKKWNILENGQAADPANGTPEIIARPTRDKSKPTVPNIHYADDYVDFNVLRDTDFNTTYDLQHPDPGAQSKYSASALPSTIKVDVFRDSIYGGPEPLTTVFNGLRTAITKFRERAVTSDKACVIFHDETLAWTRILELTNDFDYLLKLTDPTIYRNPDSSIDMTRGLPLLIQHGLFPLPYANTDIKAAMVSALEQFKNLSNLSDHVPISNFLVVISDGLATCTSCIEPAALKNLYDNNGDGKFDNFRDSSIFQDCIGDMMEGGNQPGWRNDPDPSIRDLCKHVTDWDPNKDGVTNGRDREFLYSHKPGSHFSTLCTVAGCRNSSLYNYRSMIQLQEFAEYNLAPANIPAHIIQVGNHVAPHTVDIPGANPSQCLTDSEMRSQERTDFVLGGDASGQSFGAGRTDAERLTAMDNAFDNMSPTNPYYGASPDLYSIAQVTGGIWGPLRAQKSGCTPDPKKNNPPLCEPSTLRQLHDPYCRSQADQINDYMERIVGENPYQVVLEK